MQVISCGSIPTAKIKMTIGGMENEGAQVMIYEKKEGQNKPFYTPVPKHVAKKLQIGDMITVVCIPVKDLEFATETLGLAKHTSEFSSEKLFDRAHYLD